MPAPYPDQQRRARTTLTNIFGNPSLARVIHYSCESFDNRLDGRSPRITSIAIRRLDSSDTDSFSIHRVAERNHVALPEIEEHYDELERQMLAAFFEYVKTAGEVTYIHWNMRDANYGFAAIEHRFAVLGGTPSHIPEAKRVDLSPLLVDLYGSDYIEHPRMLSLVRKNGITTLSALSGEQEALAFARKEYVALHQSTLRKVEMLTALAERASRGTLETNASWWVVHGGNVRGLWMWLVSNQSLLFLIAAIGVVITIASTVAPAIRPIITSH